MMVPYRKALILICALLIAGGHLSAQGPAKPPDIPVTAGLTFVLAVHNPNAAPAGSRIATGDYEMVVARRRRV